MDDRQLQSIRHKLQRRMKKLNSVDWRLLQPTLKQFWSFFDRTLVLRAIVDALLASPECKDSHAHAACLGTGEYLKSDNEIGAAGDGYCILRRVTDEQEGHLMEMLEGVAMRFRDSPRCQDGVVPLLQLYLEPFCEYVDEHLDDERAMLAFLLKYKQRCEWFRRAELQNRLQDADPRKAEESLASDLFEYLHEQGIDFHIEPRSASGRPDVVVQDPQFDEKPVVEAKVFDPGRSKGKPYLIKGFHQLYCYLRDHNQPMGHLLVYKDSADDIKFPVGGSGSLFPCFNYNSKTIFFVVIDIFEHEEPASKRGQLRTWEIGEADLISIITDAEKDELPQA